MIKGQAWNIVQSLWYEVSRSSCISPLGAMLIILQDEGPLELTRRQKVLVWDDEVESTREMLKTEDEGHHEGEDPSKTMRTDLHLPRLHQYFATPRSRSPA